MNYPPPNPPAGFNLQNGNDLAQPKQLLHKTGHENSENLKFGQTRQTVFIAAIVTDDKTPHKGKVDRLQFCLVQENQDRITHLKQPMHNQEWANYRPFL